MDEEDLPRVALRRTGAPLWAGARDQLIAVGVVLIITVGADRHHVRHRDHVTRTELSASRRLPLLLPPSAARLR